VSCGEQSNEKQGLQIQVDTLTFFDTLRMRKIPVALYHFSIAKHKHCKRLILFNHGYNFNSPNSYLSYSYLMEALAGMGYLVASVQQELAGDDTIAFEGDIQKLRRPFWERGAANNSYVIEELKRMQVLSDDAHVSLIGHSNGGDIVMYQASVDSTAIDEVISLDHLRAKVPVRNGLRVLSLRALDKEPDKGVLPPEPYPAHITIRKLKFTNHSDMSDGNTAIQQQEVRGHILTFLDLRKRK
jgi:hypothetical protein